MIPRHDFIQSLFAQDNDRLRAAVEALAGAASPLVAVTARRDEHAHDRQKFFQLLENLQA